MLKPIIMQLVEQGLTNQEIEEKTGASAGNISKVRGMYNKSVPPEQRKASLKKLLKPKEGTKSRIAYDYMELYPNARLSEMVRDTELTTSVCGKVRHLYFTPTAKEQLAKQRINNAS